MPVPSASPDTGSLGAWWGDPADENKASSSDPGGTQVVGQGVSTGTLNFNVGKLVLKIVGEKSHWTMVCD